MRRVEARIVKNRKEDPANTWLVEAKLDEDVLAWESVRLDFRFSEIDAEIVESRCQNQTASPFVHAVNHPC
jgi:hypothetical protein